MPALTLVPLLERYLVLETAMPRGDIWKRPSAHLYSMVSWAHTRHSTKWCTCSCWLWPRYKVVVSWKTNSHIHSHSAGSFFYAACKQNHRTKADEQHWSLSKRTRSTLEANNRQHLTWECPPWRWPANINMRTLTHNNVLKSPTSHQARFFGTVCQEECTHAYRKTHYTQSRGCINTNPAGVLCDVNSRLSLRVLATDWIPLGNKQAAAGLSDVLAFNGAHRLTRMLHLGNMPCFFFFFWWSKYKCATNVQLFFLHTRVFNASSASFYIENSWIV